MCMGLSVCAALPPLSSFAFFITGLLILSAPPRLEKYTQSPTAASATTAAARPTKRPTCPGAPSSPPCEVVARAPPSSKTSPPPWEGEGVRLVAPLAEGVLAESALGAVQGEGV